MTSISVQLIIEGLCRNLSAGDIAFIDPSAAHPDAAETICIDRDCGEFDRKCHVNMKNYGHA